MTLERLERLERLEARMDWAERQNAAENPECPPELLDRLSRDKDHGVRADRWDAAGDTGCSPALPAMESEAKAGSPR